MNDAQGSGVAAVSSDSNPMPTTGRVEGWVRYYEYFHKLNADMQTTSEISAQRRSWGPGFPPPRVTKEDACFEAIAQAIREQDMPLVHIEDGADGSAVLSDKVSGIPGGRKLTDNDLALVHAQLRAAAYSSNMRALAAEEAQQQEIAQQAAEAGRKKASTKRSGKGDDSVSPTACAAAIETLLWFGLALGESDKGFQGPEGGSELDAVAMGAAAMALAPGKKKGKGSVSASTLMELDALSSQLFDIYDASHVPEEPPLSPTGVAPGASRAFTSSLPQAMPDLSSWDWEAATSEANNMIVLHDAAPDAVKVAPPATDDSRSPILTGSGSESSEVDDGARHTPVSPMTPVAAAPLAAPTHPRAPTDTVQPLSLAGPLNEGNVSLQRLSSMGSVYAESHATTEGTWPATSSPEMSPVRSSTDASEASPNRATRRSPREQRPSRPHEIKAPLLTWEKERDAVRMPHCKSARRTESIASEEVLDNRLQLNLPLVLGAATTVDFVADPHLTSAAKRQRA